MKTCVLFAICCFFLSTNAHRRFRRDVAGTLDIINNNAQPIHADVKSENPDDSGKPCADSNKPSRIEPGVVFQVIPPSSDAVYQKSLRKSLPVPATSTLDLVRSVNRLLALFVLAATAAVESYPVLAHLVHTIYNFLWE